MIKKSVMQIFPLVKLRKLRSKKCRLKKKHPSGWIITGNGFHPKEIMLVEGSSEDATINSPIVSFDENGFTIDFSVIKISPPNSADAIKPHR